MNVGDQGQRYEIRAIGYPMETESVIGWNDDMQGADGMAAAILLAPGCKKTIIRDRVAGLEWDFGPALND
jgi:hypothetical protein